MKKLIYTFGLVLFTAMMAIANHMEETVKPVKTGESSVEWTGKKVTGKHYGTVGIKSGELKFDGDALVGGSFVIDMTTITVDDLEGEWGDKLLGHLKSDDFFGVENHNTATFTITEVMAKDGVYAVTGDLTIKGKTAPVTFTANVDGSTATADITVDRTVYDIRYGSGKFFDNLGDKTINDNFTLAVSLAY